MNTKTFSDPRVRNTKGTHGMVQHKNTHKKALGERQNRLSFHHYERGRTAVHLFQAAQVLLMAVKIY